MAIKNKHLKNKVTGQEIIFIQTSKDTDGKLLEMESIYRGSSIEPSPHYHPNQTEDFEVLEGEITIRIHNQVKILKSGEKLNIPKNTIHSMWNNSNETTRVNWKVYPALNTENLLETGVGLANDGKTDKNGLPNILQSALIVLNFSDVYRLAKPSYIIQKIIFTILAPIALLLGYKSTYKKYID